jgi:hypothetical protein
MCQTLDQDRIDFPSENQLELHRYISDNFHFNHPTFGGLGTGMCLPVRRACVGSCWRSADCRLQSAFRGSAYDGSNSMVFKFVAEKYVIEFQL